MTVPLTRTRLSEARLGELFGAVLDLLRELGYEALTMDAVAARAHTSKATLYRQWDGKPGLVVAALQHSGPADPPVADTGGLRGDLAAMLDHNRRQHERHAAEKADLVPALMHAMLTDPELRRVMREQIINKGTARLNEVFGRAVARGEIDPQCPALPYAADLIVSFGLSHAVLRAQADEQPDFLAFIDDVVVPLLTARR
jgi:AcrR family transcriptional regulator